MKLWKHVTKDVLSSKHWWYFSLYGISLYVVILFMWYFSLCGISLYVGGMLVSVPWLTT